MAYTIHWIRPEELPARIFAAATLDLQRVLLTRPDLVAGPWGDGSPVITDNEVSFNGKAAMVADSFHIFRKEITDKRRGPFRTDEVSDLVLSWCDTNRLPYDLAVKSALLIFKHHVGHRFSLGSENQDVREWKKAGTLCRSLLGYPNDLKWFREVPQIELEPDL